MDGQFPQLPERIREILDQFVPGFYPWISDVTRFMQKGFTTGGDAKFSTAGKGIVLKNAAGTVTKRVRLNNIGDGIIIEDV